MSKMKTRVVVILDQSGSMGGTKAQAVQGYNEQIQQMKLNSKDQEILGSLITFNGEVFEHLWDVPADELTEATAEDYKTEGSTAMRDAVGYAINKLTKTADPNDTDVAYLVVIISDGEENASKHYNSEALAELKESVDRTGKWTFTYMGCDDRYLKKVAKELNIPISNVAKWSNSCPELAAHGQHMNAVKMRGFYTNRAKGVTTQACVQSNDVSCLADYTSDVGDAVNIASDLWQPPLNANILNDGHKVTCDTGTSPFKNYSPVSWNG